MGKNEAATRQVEAPARAEARSTCVARVARWQTAATHAGGASRWRQLLHSNKRTRRTITPAQSSSNAPPAEAPTRVRLCTATHRLAPPQVLPTPPLLHHSCHRGTECPQQSVWWPVQLGAQQADRIRTSDGRWARWYRPSSRGVPARRRKLYEVIGPRAHCGDAQQLDLPARCLHCGDDRWLGTHPSSLSRPAADSEPMPPGPRAGQTLALAVTPWLPPPDTRRLRPPPRLPAEP